MFFYVAINYLPILGLEEVAEEEEEEAEEEEQEEGGGKKRKKMSKKRKSIPTCLNICSYLI